MLKGLFQKMFGKRLDADTGVPAASLQMTPAQLEQLLRDVVRTNELELNCSSTFELIDEYIDRLSRGEDAAAIMPLVSQHLDLCPECEEEYNMLMQVVDSLAGDGKLP